VEHNPFAEWLRILFREFRKMWDLVFRR